MRMKEWYEWNCLKIWMHDKNKQLKKKRILVAKRKHVLWQFKRCLGLVSDVIQMSIC